MTRPISQTSARAQGLGRLAVRKNAHRGATLTPLTPRMPLVVLIALVWALLVDIPTSIGLGPLSVSGVATVAVAGGLGLVGLGIFCTRDARSPVGQSFVKEAYLIGRSDESRLPRSFAIFLAVAAVTFVFAPTPDGLQNVAVYAMFGLAIPVTAQYCSAGTADRAMYWMARAGIVVGVIVAVQSVVKVEVYGPRSAALLLLVFISVALAVRQGTLSSWALPALLLLSCALTLSRTALFVGAILLPLSFVFTAGKGGIAKLVVLAVPIYSVMYILVTRWAPLRDRFLEGDAAFAIGGVNLNTSGRSVLWQMTTDSWLEKPLLGHGAGSASAMISARFSNISHPHNDYLRVLHDFGILGFVPFLVGFLYLIFAVSSRARKLGEPIHRAAALALIAVALVALTDNVFVYPFVMLPVGVLVGLSLARPRRGSPGYSRHMSLPIRAR